MAGQLKFQHRKIRRREQCQAALHETLHGLSLPGDACWQLFSSTFGFLDSDKAVKSCRFEKNNHMTKPMWQHAID